MSAHPLTRRTAEVERQLAALAASRERSNRPLPMVFAAGVLLVIGLVVLLWGVMSAASARSALSRERARAARWEEHLRAIESLSQSTPDLAKLYPISAFIKSDLEKVRDAVWGTTPQDAQALIISAPKLKRTFPDSPIEELFVECSSSTGVSLERLMEFLNSAIERQGDKPTFVAHLQLTPIPSSANWRTTVRIGMYQVVRELAGSAE